MPAARPVVHALGAACFASAPACIFLLHRLAEARRREEHADALYLVRYLRRLACVFARSPIPALAPANRRDVRTVRFLRLVFATAASLVAWRAAPHLRAALS
jgi:hypothetical protein